MRELSRDAMFMNRDMGRIACMMEDLADEKDGCAEPQDVIDSIQVHGENLSRLADELAKMTEDDVLDDDLVVEDEEKGQDSGERSPVDFYHGRE